MEKLLELLNEYDPYIQKDGELRDNSWYFVYKGGSAIFPKEIGMLKIISKEYGYIKWLVENEKIDRYKFEVEYMDKQTLEDVYIAGAKQDELLIMILSISDTPIEDLISYLK